MNRYTEMQVFVRAAEDGSFSAAARNLAITPSAVSKLITRMEERLGALLFRRAHRNIVMTPEGEVFYRAALAAIEAVEADRVSQGHYAYVYQLEDDAPVGAWTADWQTTNGAQVIKEPPFGAFAVVVSPA